jgi:hypothetical protein
VGQWGREGSFGACVVNRCGLDSKARFREDRTSNIEREREEKEEREERERERRFFCGEEAADFHR